MIHHLSKFRKVYAMSPQVSASVDDQWDVYEYLASMFHPSKIVGISINSLGASTKIIANGKKELEKFTKDMDELIEETLTDDFADYGDVFHVMENFISTFLAFKDKVKSKPKQELIGYRF